MCTARPNPPSFHRHLNPMIAILDPNRKCPARFPLTQVHTLDYIRGSTILFTAVIAVGSRFIRKELHQPLLTHAQMILNRATATGDVNIGIIQALLILMYWKAPSDRSAWVKIGIAIRLGYQMGMHIPRTEPLPEDERLARIIRNAERTWFCECVAVGVADEQVRVALTWGGFSFEESDLELTMTGTLICLNFRPPFALRNWERWVSCASWSLAHPPGRGLGTRGPLQLRPRHARCVVGFVSANSPTPWLKNRTHPSHILWIRYKQMRNSLPVEWCRSVLNDVYSQYQRHMDHWFPHDDCELGSQSIGIPAHAHSGVVHPRGSTLPPMVRHLEPAQGQTRVPELRDAGRDGIDAARVPRHCVDVCAANRAVGRGHVLNLSARHAERGAVALRDRVVQGTPAHSFLADGSFSGASTCRRSSRSSTPSSGSTHAAPKSPQGKTTRRRRSSRASSTAYCRRSRSSRRRRPQWS